MAIVAAVASVYGYYVFCRAHPKMMASGEFSNGVVLIGITYLGAAFWLAARRSFRP